MKLNEFKEEVYKCSGCGLCQGVCPIYKILKTECAVSRGKFKLLNAVINKDINFSQKTLEIMDLCLHCGACSEFCPSGIDAQKIIETAQADMLSCSIFSFKKIFVAKIFANKFCLNIIKYFVNFLRDLKLLEIPSALGFKKIKLLKSFLKIKIKPIEKTSAKGKSIKAIYFRGCINNYVNPSAANAVLKVLDKTNVGIIEPDFNCCGLPLKSVGDIEAYRKLAIDNIDKIPETFDFLIFDCQSCKSTFKNYSQILEGEYKQKAENISKKCISIYELLEIIDYKPKKKWKKYNLTCHYPCHTRFSKDKEIMKNLIGKIPNTQFIEAQNADSCCGAAGNFILSQEKISQKISETKAQEIINTDAQIVLTSCPSCYLGLKQGLIAKKSNIKVMQLIEFLAE